MVNPNALLGPGDPPAVRILNRHGAARCVLLCDHASFLVPPSLGTLGLDAEDFMRHYAGDIGAARMTETLSELLDAPAVLGGYSRLVVDLNRWIDHPTAFAEDGEGKPVPGNIGLSQAERLARIEAFYEPYHGAVDAVLTEREDKGIAPAVISIHSFTPVFFGQARVWEIGMLWTHDPRLPVPMMKYFTDRGYIVGDNEPYDARDMRGVTHAVHADGRRLANVLIEVRQDLVADNGQADHWATMIAESLQEPLRNPETFTKFGGPFLPVADPDYLRAGFTKSLLNARKEL